MQPGDLGALLHQARKRAAFLFGREADVATGQAIRQRTRLRALEQIEGLGMVALLEQDLDRPIVEVQLVGEIAAAVGFVLELAAIGLEQIERAAVGDECRPEVALHVIEQPIRESRVDRGYVAVAAVPRRDRLELIEHRAQAGGSLRIGGGEVLGDQDVARGLRLEAVRQLTDGLVDREHGAAFCACISARVMKPSIWRARPAQPMCRSRTPLRVILQARSICCRHLSVGRTASQKPMAIQMLPRSSRA